MPEFLRVVAATIRRHGMLEPGDRVAVAVSGGADSVTLLCGLEKLRGEFGIELAVAHVDHRLREEESAADADFAAALAERRRLPFHLRRFDTARVARSRRQNVESTARELRYGFFGELIASGAAAKVATGHTLSDQAETVLFRVLRGSGGAGLAAIRPVREPGVVRPLLDVDREQVRRYARRHGLTWREDASNADRRFARNRIRAELLPALERDWNPNITALLGGLAERSRAEEEYWQAQVDRAAGQILRRERGAVLLSASAVVRLPLALARRLLMRALCEVRGGETGEIEFAHIESLLDLARAPEGRGAVHLPGVQAQRSFDPVRLISTSNSGGRHSEYKDFALNFDIPAVVDLPAGPTRLEVQLRPVSGAHKHWGYNKEIENLLSAERLPRRLAVRHWKPGDCLRPHGRSRAHKLKELFQDHRVPAWERNAWPVVTASKSEWTGSLPRELAGQDEVVLWTRSFGASADFAPSGRPRRVIEIIEV